jgi:hypothetical protein
MKVFTASISVVPAHPIPGLPEIGILPAHVGNSRHAVGTHIPETTMHGTMGPRLRGGDTVHEERAAT